MQTKRATDMTRDSWASLPALFRHLEAINTTTAQSSPANSTPPSSGSTTSSATTLAMPAVINRQNHHVQGASLDGGPPASSVAADESRKIKLTRYCTLPAEDGLRRLAAGHGAGAGEAQDVDGAQETRRPTGDKTESRMSNKLWTIAGHQQPMEQQQQQQASVGLRKADGPNQEPFQIVWTQLAFEVRLSAYDKILNKTYSCLRAIGNLGGGGGGGGGGATKTIGSSDLQRQLEAGISKSNSAAAAGAPDKPRTENSKRSIFENLSGYVNSGELTAILGPSGSGKTSLLNAICGRTDNYRGQLRLVGAGKQRRMRLSIIPQKDYLIENLTVRENLLYSSKILNPDPGHDHEASVARVVRMLNLGACYHSSAANISGGEYKRVSIAQELLRQPDILVLDEPTSGLDSLNCKKLIRSLVQLIEASREGHQLRPIAIVMTIHQPDVEVFHMFHHIYCMARAGRVIFDGRPCEALAHLQRHANIPPLCSSDRRHDRDDQQQASGDAPLHCKLEGAINPANLLIEIASEDLYGQEPIERLARVQRKQIEQMLDPATGAMTPVARREACASPKRDQLSQLEADLLLVEQQLAGMGATAPARSERDPWGQLKANQLLFEQQLAGMGAHDQEEQPKDVNDANNSSGAQHDQHPNLTSSSSSGSSPAPSQASAQQNEHPHQHPHQHGRRLVRDKRLTVKNDHSGRFWYYTRVLAQRAFKSSLRDPLMTLITMIFHLAIPFVMYTVYPRRIGTTHGCPVIQHELDIVSMASNRTADRLEDLHEQVIGTLECSTMFFLTTYSFSMCSLTVSALAFPLSMHVLLKEVRNGWYNLPAYVLAKTLANFPFEVLFPMVSLVMIYSLLDMPGSVYEWRMCAMALVMALVSMISHTQGLIFGALCMDSVQTAIFMASASTLPQALLSGFTARIRFMPLLLQRLSWLSQYRYSSDLINMIRFGFGICPCSPATDDYLRTQAPEFKDMPGNLKPVFIYYLMSNAQASESAALELANATQNATTPPADGSIATTLSPVNSTTGGWPPAATPPPPIPGVDNGVMLAPGDRYALLKRMDAGEVDLFANMAEMISRAFSFGRKLDGCPSVRSQLLATGGTPPDHTLPLMFAGMLGLLLACKLILFLTVKHKIGARL